MRRCRSERGVVLVEFALILPVFLLLLLGGLELNLRATDKSILVYETQAAAYRGDASVPSSDRSGVCWSPDVGGEVRVWAELDRSSIAPVPGDGTLTATATWPHPTNPGQPVCP